MRRTIIYYSKSINVAAEKCLSLISNFKNVLQGEFWNGVYQKRLKAQIEDVDHRV